MRRTIRPKLMLMLLLASLPVSSACVPAALDAAGAEPAAPPQESASPLTIDADKLLVSYSRWDAQSRGVVTEKKSLAEVLCTSRSGIWDGTSCESPLAYGTNNVDRQTSDQMAYETCPTIAGQHYIPADCWTVMHLLRSWRLLPGVEIPPVPLGHAYAWCTGSADGTPNTLVEGQRGAPGFWGRLHAAPKVCPDGQALAADQLADGIPVTNKGYRPHLYCVDMTAQTRWLCMAPRMP